MINAVINGILDFFTFLFSKIIDLITIPFTLAIRSFFPNINSFLGDVENFITNYIFKGVHFFKMVFVNALGINHLVFDIVVTIFAFTVYVFIMSGFLKMVYNLWKIYKGGKTK